jgi:hypothetical protein
MWAIRSTTADPLFRFVQAKKVGYIDASGKIVIPPTLPEGDNFSGEFHEGLLQVSFGRPGRSREGYVDRTGERIFEIDAINAGDFSGGLAAIWVKDKDKEFNYRTGYADRTGRFVIQPSFHFGESFSEGLARVSAEGEVGSTGYIDRTGKYVIEPKLSYGSDFHEGLAAAIVDGPCKIVNGGSCARAEFRPTQSRDQNVCRWSFIDRNGKPISQERFDDAKDFSEGLAPVRTARLFSDKWGYIGRDARIAINYRFDDAESFSEGLAAVYIGSKAGFIDHSGNIVIRPQFDYVQPFSNGRALVQSGKSSKFIDKQGRDAFPSNFEEATPFRHGLAHVRLKDGRYAYINTSGKIVFTYSER